jgi:hypothetical protein
VSAFVPPTLTAADFLPELAAVDALTPHPRNYRAHPDDQLDHIARSIELHGFYRNVVVARDDTILAGHGVVLAARRLGRDTIPVYRLDVEPDSTAAMQVLAGDNEMGNLADIDDRALSELLRELAQDDLANLLGTGFDELSLAALAMVTRPASELADLDEAGEWLGLPGFERPDDTPTLLVKFDSDDDRARFLAEIGYGADRVSRIGGGHTIWWPDRPLNDLTSLRFQ